MATTNPPLGSKWLEVPNEPTIWCRKVEVIQYPTEWNMETLPYWCYVLPLPPHTIQAVKADRHQWKCPCVYRCDWHHHFPRLGTELDKWFRGETLDTSISIPSPTGISSDPRNVFMRRVKTKPASGYANKQYIASTGGALSCLWFAGGFGAVGRWHEMAINSSYLTHSWSLKILQ